MSAMLKDATPATKYLQPGQIHVTDAPTVITTIIGSCVAVCLWDSRVHVGGMNHFMLPHYAGSGVKSARFGNVAMQELLDKMLALGARIPFLQARVYGGACMFEQLQTSAQLGQKNIQLALDFLSLRGIDVIEVEVGGNRGRKLRFHTTEGDACLTSI